MDEQASVRVMTVQQVALSERCDRRGMGADGTAHPARQVWRRQTDGDHARGGERSYVRSVDRLSVARNPEDLPPKSTVYDYFDLWTYDGTLQRIHHALYDQCREQAQREASPTAAIIDSQSVKSAEQRGPASMRRVTTLARKSRASSGTFSSIH